MKFNTSPDLCVHPTLKKIGGYPRLVEKYLLPICSCSAIVTPRFLSLLCSRRSSRPLSRLGSGKRMLGRGIPPPQIPPLSAPVCYDLAPSALVIAVTPQFLLHPHSAKNPGGAHFRGSGPRPTNEGIPPN